MKKDKMRYCFLGNMNNMGFVFSREMKRQNLDVTLFVDAEKNNILDRPESIDETIGSPYPSWIKELSANEKKSIQQPFILSLQKKIYLKLIAPYDVIILNGNWIRLGKYIPPEKKVIILFAGYDLEVLADFKSIDSLLEQHRQFFLFPVLRPFLKFKYKRVVQQQRAGISRADGLNYFPKGINPDGDALIAEIKGGKSFRQLQLRGFPFDNVPAIPFRDHGRFIILNFTRFFFLDKTRNDNKRNDIMISGIAEFISSNHLSPAEIGIIFFKKGPDIAAAEKMCETYGLSPFITWEEEVTQKELNLMIADADVIFDQLGDQWLGYGIVAMAMGRPVIANGRPDIFDELTGEKSPVCNAVNAQEVTTWLEILYHDKTRKEETGRLSRQYILKHYDIEKTAAFIASF